MLLAWTDIGLETQSLSIIGLAYLDIADNALIDGNSGDPIAHYLTMGIAMAVGTARGIRSSVAAGTLGKSVGLSSAGRGLPYSSINGVSFSTSAIGAVYVSGRCESGWLYQQR